MPSVIERQQRRRPGAADLHPVLTPPDLHFVRHLTPRFSLHRIGREDTNRRFARNRLSGDSGEIVWAQQGDQGSSVHRRQPALAQLDLRTCEAGDLGGEIGLVPDEENVASARSRGRSSRSDHLAAPP